MGLFDKKICDICGEKIGLLGNRKLDDGNLCKDCAKKLSPWFEDRRHSTVEDIKRQLEYREKNKKAVMDFCITRQINTRNYNVFIDDNKGNFTVARKLDVNENPDIVPLSTVAQCRVDVERQQNEETYTTKDGETVSYQPPVYKSEFDYTMRIKVKNPWFDDMDFLFMIRLENISAGICIYPDDPDPGPWTGSSDVSRGKGWRENSQKNYCLACFCGGFDHQCFYK